MSGPFGRYNVAAEKAGKAIHIRGKSDAVYLLRGWGLFVLAELRDETVCT